MIKQFERLLRRYVRRLRLSVALQLAWLLSPRLRLRVGGVAPIAGGAKQSGMGDKIQVDDSGGVLRDISNDVTSLTLNTPRGVQEVTGLDKSAIERLLLLADGEFTLNGVFNAAANKSHDVFKTVGSTSVLRTVTYDISPATTGSPRLTMECVASEYNVTRAASGELTWTVKLSLADGTAPAWTTVP